MTRHLTVLLEEVVKVLTEGEWSNRKRIIVDCTLGGGGHSEAILMSDSSAYVVGFDRDQQALHRATERLKQFKDRFTGVCAPFSQISSELAKLDWSNNYPVAGIIADLGISSDQLDDAERGFSFSNEGPLDMRMNKNQVLSAASVLNTYEAHELKKVFFVGGMRKGVTQLVKEILTRRPFETTRDFADVCVKVLSRFERQGKKNPATVPFQALRIEVNKEFVELESLLEQGLEVLSPGGRLAVISFHSLEDKIVANTMRGWARKESLGRRAPGELAPERGSLLTKKAIVPTEKEILSNSRSRSARLRVFEKSFIQ